MLYTINILEIVLCQNVQSFHLQKKVNYLSSIMSWAESGELVMTFNIEPDWLHYTIQVCSFVTLVFHYSFPVQMNWLSS